MIDDAASRSLLRNETFALVPPFQPDGGHAFLMRLPPGLHGQTDNDAAPQASRLILMEDDHPLPIGHATHADIRGLGRGRYSFWKDALWFSSSDSSDPNSNGRRYCIALGEDSSGRLSLHPGARPPAPDWIAPDDPVGIALIGTGQRGFAFIKQLLKLGGTSIRWIADTASDRCSELVEFFSLGSTRISSNWRDTLTDPEVEAVLIAVPDHLHAEIAIEAFRAGKNVYLEKPVATTLADGCALVAAWRESGRILHLGYVLRHAPFYATIRTVLRSEALGRVATIDMSEHLGVVHGASFMRRWHGSSAQSGGLIVHKGCHDLDLACWLLDTVPRSVVSFGGRDTFRPPAPAPFCSICPERPTCRFVDTGAYEYRTSAEAADPSAFGLDRCVFRDDIDIVDNQVVAFELANGTRGTFRINVQGPGGSERRIVIVGDDARLSGDFGASRFTIEYNDGRADYVWSRTGETQGHGGGDRGSMIAFLDQCVGRGASELAVDDVLAGLALAVAAEESRRRAQIIRIDPAIFTG
jgi:predicted dehydrogenase